MSEEKNKNAKAMTEVNGSLKSLNEFTNNRKENDIINRRKYKKKTLKRITLDPPDELEFIGEGEQIIQKPDEVSRSKIFESCKNIRNMSSNSVLLTPHSKLKNGIQNFSLSNHKIYKAEEKWESKNQIEEYKLKKIKFEEGNENPKKESESHNFNIKQLINDENSENKDKSNNLNLNDNQNEKEERNVKQNEGGLNYEGDNIVFISNQEEENNEIINDDNNKKEENNKVEKKK